MVNIRVSLLALEKLIDKDSVGKLSEPAYTPIKLEIAKYEEAQKLEQSGKWQDSANAYYTIFLAENDANTKGKALTSLAQSLINLSCLNQAQMLLLKERAGIETKLSKEHEKLFFQARIEEKLGWIADYQNDPSIEVKYFENAKKLLEQIGHKNLDQDMKAVFATVISFLGRGHVLLASQDINPKTNIKKAKKYFENDLNAAVKNRLEGNPQYAREGFQHMWLSCCFRLENNLPKAKKHLDMAKLIWEEGGTNESSGIFSHYFLALGVLYFEENDIINARKYFSESLRIRTKIEPYPKGKASSLLGLALCDLFESNINEAKKRAEEAIKIYPYVLSRGLI